MKILVTGSEGYIGTILVKSLIEKGYEVIGLDTCFYAEAWFSKEPKLKYKLIKKDIRNIKKTDLKDFDAVIHLAELSNDPLGEIDPEITEKINHLGTVNLIKIAKSQKVKRFIYFSSCSVYGASEKIANEKSKTNPQTAYAKSKILNEKALLKMADEKFTPVILRNATVYGISPRMRFDIAVNNLTGIAWTSNEIKMQSDGKPWRPFIHVQDLCDITMKILEAPKEKVFNQIFNIGSSSSNYQIKEIAEAVQDVFPIAKISFNRNGADKRNYRVNFHKLEKTFPEFSCKRNLKRGIQELFSAFDQMRLNIDLFNSEKFTRLKQIKYLLETKKLSKDLYWNN